MIPEYINSRMTEIEVKKERDKVDGIIGAIKDPNFDYNKLSPQDYQLLQKYQPQVAAFVAEKAPTLVKADSAGALAGRAAQMQALEKYRQLGQTGEDSQSRIMRDQALQAAQSQNQGQQASIMDQFQRQGQGGSGNNLVAALLAQQGAGRNATMASQQAGTDAMQQRLQALKEGASLGGTVRGEDVNMEGQNANILNSYNQRFAANQNLFNQYAANTQNDAQRYNIGAAQQIANMNTGQQNQASNDYQNRYNALQQQQFGDASNKANMSIGNQNNRIQETKQVAADRAAINRQTEQDVLSIMPWTSGGASGRNTQGGGGSGYTGAQQGSNTVSSGNNNGYWASQGSGSGGGNYKNYYDDNADYSA